MSLAVTMATSPHGRVASPLVRCAVTHGTGSGEFVDLIVSDEDWVRREFDAIVAAGWGGAVPPSPEQKQGAHWPRRPGYDCRPTTVRRFLTRLIRAGSVVRERGPPM